MHGAATKVFPSRQTKIKYIPSTQVYAAGELEGQEGAYLVAWLKATDLEKAGVNELACLSDPAQWLTDFHKNSGVVSEDENEDDKLLMATGGYNAADLQRSYPEVIEGVGESLSGVDESLSGDIKSLKRLIYGAHAQVGALTARLDKQDARLEGVVETKTASTALYRSFRPSKKRSTTGALHPIHKVRKCDSILPRRQYESALGPI